MPPLRPLAEVATCTRTRPDRKRRANLLPQPLTAKPEPTYAHELGKWCGRWRTARAQTARADAHRRARPTRLAQACQGGPRRRRHDGRCADARGCPGTGSPRPGGRRRASREDRAPPRSGRHHVGLRHALYRRGGADGGVLFGTSSASRRRCRALPLCRAVRRNRRLPHRAANPRWRLRL